MGVDSYEDKPDSNDLMSLSYLKMSQNLCIIF